MLPYIQNSHSVTLFVQNRPFTVKSTNPNYNTIIEKLEAGDDDGFEPLLESLVIQAIKEFPDFTIKNNTLVYRDQPQSSYLSQKILHMLEVNKPVAPALRHFIKTQKNPSNRVVEELYRFMEVNDLPITPDGDFLAYKRVNGDYTDVYSKTKLNTIGAVLTMPRNRVDDNPNRTCSHGLHVCAFDYLTSFTGERIVVCKVNPEDVVAIPTDYNHTKMRVCRYEVVGEIPLETAENVWAEKRLIDSYEPVREPREEDEYDPYTGDEEEEENYNDD